MSGFTCPCGDCTIDLPESTDEADDPKDATVVREQTPREYELSQAIRVMPTVRVAELDRLDVDGVYRQFRAICSCGWDGAIVLGESDLPAYEARMHMIEHLKEEQ